MINHRERLFHKKKSDPFNVRIKSAYNLFRNRINREKKFLLKKRYFLKKKLNVLVR